MAWNAADYAAHAGFVPALGAAVLGELAPRPGEVILDLGCGDGVLTAEIGKAGAAVLGIDPDPEMLAAARTRGLAVMEGSGEALPFEERFDAVFSNAALHWIPDQEAVAAGVFRALKPGGRYVGECGGFGNIAAIRVAIRAVLARRGHDPAAAGGQVYQRPEAFIARHEAAGFTSVEARLIHRPTPLSSGIAGWLTTFRGGFLDAAGVSAADQPTIFAEIEDLLAPILQDEAGQWTADYVRLRWRALKPA